MKSKVICECATYDPIVGNGTLCHYIIFTMWAAFTHKSDLSNGPQIHVDLNWTKLLEFDHLFFQVINIHLYVYYYDLYMTVSNVSHTICHSQLDIFTEYFHVIIWRFENKFVFFLIEIWYSHQCSYFNKWWTSLSLYSTSLKLSIMLKFSPSFTYCSDFIHSFFPFSLEHMLICLCLSISINILVCIVAFDRLCERVLVTPRPSLFPITPTV